MAENKLSYFDFGGRGEWIRLIFAASGVPFQDERIDYLGFKDTKDKYPMGKVPVLTTPETTLTETLVIARFVARRSKLAGESEADEFFLDAFVHALHLDVFLKLAEMFFEKDPAKKASIISAGKVNVDYLLHRLDDRVRGDFVLGNAMTYADLHVLDTTFWLEAILPEVKLPKKLQGVVDRVKAHPKVASYLASRGTNPPP